MTGLAALAALAACALVAQEAPEEHQDFSLGGGAFQVLGVGKRTSDRFVCWDPRGRLDPGLTDEVTRLVAKLRLSFVEHVSPGRKSRFLVVREVNDSRAAFRVNVQRPANGQGWTWTQHLNMRAVSEDGTSTMQSTKLHGFTADLEASVLTLVAQELHPVVPGTSFAAKPGEEFQLAGARVAYRGVERSSKKQDMFGVARPQWLVHLEVLEPSEASLTLFPQTRDGADVVGVDERGRPTDRLWRAANPVPPRKGATRVDQRPPGPMAWTMLNFNPTQRGVVNLESSVDPRSVSRYRVLATVTKTVELSGLAIDPRP